MAENSLPESQVRLGRLSDGNPDTPEVAVMLQNTGEEIILTIPTGGPEDPYMRWFGRDIEFGDDPDRTKFSYRPPRVLIFDDYDGTVVLVGCRAAGMSSNLFAGVGRGRIVPNFAILDGRNSRYESVNGLRSEIPGLSQWAGLTSVKSTPTTDDDGRRPPVHPARVPGAVDRGRPVRPEGLRGEHRARPRVGDPEDSCRGVRSRH